ncbi:type II/IV secretion system ATPase subunit [Thermoplasma volcanium]|nr:type II/IV secretion system ATPase subunit [Thermoplasma volcanium]
MVDSDSHVTVVEPNSDQKLDTAVATVLHEISSFQSFAVERDLEDVIERISKVFRISDIDAFRYYINKSISGLGKIYPLFNLEEVKEIDVNGYDEPVIVKLSDDNYYTTNIKLLANEVDSIAIRLAQLMGKKISTSDPLARGTLNNREVSITFGTEISPKGSSIRIARNDSGYDLKKFVESNGFSLESISYLKIAIENSKSIVIIGPHTELKYSALLFLMDLVDKEKKITYIGEKIPSRSPGNYIFMKTKEKSIFSSQIDRVSLINTAMRQRPDYIVIDTIEVVDLPSVIQAITTGHPTFTSIDIDSVSALVSAFSDSALDLGRDMVSVIDIVIEISESSDRISSIYEFDRFEHNDVLYDLVFSIDKTTEKLRYNGFSPMFRSMSNAMGKDDFHRYLENVRKITSELIENGLS